MTFDEVQETTKNLHALNTLEERKEFYKYAQEVEEDGYILDIGTCAGGSAFVFALSSKPSVSVITVDPEINQSFIENRKALGLESKIIYRKMTSSQLANEWIGGECISLMFVDGIHSGTGVTDDFNNFYPYIKDGGIIMFHDYFLYDGIRMAVDEIVKSGKAKKVDLIDSVYKKEIRTGLFIIQKTK